MIIIAKYLYLRKNHIIILLGIIFILFGSVYQFDFLYGWDDQWFVTNPYTENGFEWKNIYSIITDFYYGQYAPINQLYYTTIFSFFGYDTAIFHLLSIVIHAINVVLVYSLICFISPNLNNDDKSSPRFISFYTALLFGIMPINIEPTVWVAASKVLLYAMFYLLALISYCYYIKLNKSFYFYLTILFFIISFGAKEQAVTLPFCLLLFDFIFNRKITRVIVWYEKIPFFIISLLFGLITIQSQDIADGGNFYPMYQRIPLAFYTFGEYFTKVIIPVNLSYLYPFPFEKGNDIPWWFWSYTILILGILYCIFDLFKIKWFAFAMIFFLIHIILVINLVSLARYSVIADRYTYVASIGLCFLIANVPSFKYRWKLTKNILLTLYAISLFSYSFTYKMQWRDVNSLKERVESVIEERSDYQILQNNIK